MESQLTRNHLQTLQRHMLHEARNWTKADVYVIEWPQDSGQRVVVKDFRERPLWFRLVAGRYFLRREWKVLKALHDVSGVPHAIAKPDSDAIVMEYHPGKQLKKFKKRRSCIEVVGKLEALLQTIHAHGVTHGDLHTSNILVDSAGEVTIIDWATGSVHGLQPRLLKNYASTEWRMLDIRALAKIKLRYNPDRLTDLERDLMLKEGSKLYIFMKQFRALLAWARRPANSASGDRARQQTLRQIEKIDRKRKRKREEASAKN